MFILWYSKIYVVTYLRENNIFFTSLKQNNSTYFAKIAETRFFSYAFLLSDSVETVVCICS